MNTILTGKIKKINLKLWFNKKICFFDKKNPVNWFKFAILKTQGNQLNFWFNMNNQDIIFQFTFLQGMSCEFEFAILKQKSRKSIWICDLTWKIKKIYLNLNFWQEKSSKLIWICNFDTKSRKLIWICDLTWKIKKIYLNFLFWLEKSCKLIWICNFDMKNQNN